MENPFKQVYGLIENLVLRSAAFQKVATVYHDKRGKLGMTPGPIPFRRPQSDMRTKEIKDWQVAVMQATDPERPRRYLLYYIYQNLLRDDDLQATIENRVLPLQMASYKIVDKNGETVEKAMQLLERTWFQDLRRMSVMAQLQGTLLVDLTEKVNRKTMEIEEISEVPQCNYIAQVGAILERPTDNQGISYRSGGMETYYYQFGKDWDLGLLNILAMPIYAKKMGFGSWLNYIDLYGIPWMFVITNRMDPQRIDELYDMMADMRSAHHGVLKTGESIEFGKEVSGNTTNAFDPFMERCHQMITRLILGQTGTTNNEAYEGTAKVHEQVEKFRHEADKLLFQYVFNQEIIPRLVKISPVYSVFEGCRLEWDDHETLSLKDYIEAIKNLAYTFDFDPEKVAEMTGLPITAIKAVTNQGIQSGGNMRNNGSGNGEDDPDDDPEPPKTGKKKVTDKPDGSFASVVNSLYYDGLEAPHATAVEAASIGLPEKTIDRILERLRSKGFDVGKNIDPDLYEHTFGKLGGAVEKSYGKVEFGSPDYEFLEQMKRNVAVFSAFKTHRQQNEIHSVLFDESGKMKSFDQFRKDTKKIIEDYNVNWLRTEYDTAVSRARFASDFRRYQSNKDVMPNLEWLPSLAAHPRDAHRVFYHRIYPLDDPFWRTNYPGSLWNCQCRYRNTDKPATHGDTKESVPPAKGLGENPGITGSVFTDDHPYIKDADEEAKEAVEKFLEPIIQKQVKTIKDVQNIVDRYMARYPEDANGKKITLDTFTNKPTKDGFTMMRAYSPDGKIEYNKYKYYNNGTESPFTRLLSALNKIRDKQEMTFDEEYSLESFYHEIMHCKAKKYEVLKAHYKGDFKRTAMETINQFVSRHEYHKFIQRLGGEAIHQDKVLDNGSGYKLWVERFREFLKVTNTDEMETFKFFKEKLLNGKYGELENVMYKFMVDKGKLEEYEGDKTEAYHKAKILGAFEYIKSDKPWKELMSYITDKRQ